MPDAAVTQIEAFRRITSSMDTHPLGSVPGWGIALPAYAAWLRSANRPDSTIQLRNYHLRRFATVTGLSPYEPDLDQLVNYLASGNWSPNTRRSVRSTLRSFYKWAHVTGKMIFDPAVDLPGARAQIGQPRPAPEDAVSLGLSATDWRVRFMVALAAHAGLRCCEIAVVHARDLTRDFEGFSLRVHGKGSKIRIVPLSDQLGAALHGRLSDGGYLFPGDFKGHLSSPYVSKRVSRALPDGWTAHTLRHRFASRAYSADGDIRAVQELLGHASVATTQVYTAVPDGAKRRAMLAAA